MKRKRAESISQISSTFANIDSLSSPDETLTEISQHSSKPNHHTSSSSSFHFNDSSTSDVTLHLHLEPSSFDSIDTSDLNDVHLHLHSDILRRCKYFAALLSDRWQIHNSESSVTNLNLELKVSPITSSISAHLTVLQLLYTNDFFETINTVSTALSILPVALELLFEECINACVQFLEAVPWSEEEESKILNLIPFLGQEESQKLLSRVTPDKTSSSSLEGMLDGMILSAIKNHPNMAYVKGFVSKMLRESTPRCTVRNVLDRIFVMSLNVVKGALEEYSRPEFRGNLVETEAIQRFNLHTAMSNVRNLAWLIEMMIELKVADIAVEEWSDQPSLTADFQIAFREDAWIAIVPALPTTVLRCTLKLAAAVSSGSTLAPKAVRMNLVKNWLPVLIVCKQNVTPGNPCSKPLYQEMEETFLSIISTLPMSDAQELLQQCLSFSTRNVEDCPHLVMAFNTWFRRAARPLHLDLD